MAQIAEFAYHLFGLDFLSGKPIPGVPLAGRVAADDAVRIEFGSVPGSIRAPEYADESVQATGSEYLLDFPKVGRIYVQGSERITIELAPDSDPTGMWQIVMGVGASIAGFRRGFVPIHASAVAHGDDCVAFAGQSTAGKSTIAALLTTLGYGLHADDLCLARWSDGRVDVGQGVQELLIDCLRIRLPLLVTGQARKNFEQVAAVSSAVKMFRFVRPFDAERLAEHFDT